MTDEVKQYKQGDEFKVGATSAAAARMKLEGKRQGRDAYSRSHADEEDKMQAKRREKDFIIDASIQQIEEQAELQAKVSQKLDNYQFATSKAKSEIDAEIATLQSALKEMENNATKLDDGRRVYRDEQTGVFYDGNDQQLSADEQVQALRNYQEDDTTRQQKNRSEEKFDDLQAERDDIEAFEQDRAALEKRLEENPEDAAEIQAEIEGLDVPERVLRHYSDMPQPQAAGNIKTSSAAKAYGDGQGVQSKIALSPAFYEAGHPEQLPDAPARDNVVDDEFNNDIDEAIVRSPSNLPSSTLS